MPAATYNFDIEQGSDLQVVFEYIDENNTFVNLTNCYILLKFITNTGQIYSFDNVTDTDDYQLSTDTVGNITLTIPARITNTYDFINAIYDLDIQEPNEIYPGSGLKRYRFAQGNIGIIKRNIPTTIVDVLFPLNPNNIIDACAINCSALESVSYNGGMLQIRDNNNTANSIFISDTRPIQYVELAINGLSHPSPQDLSLFLAPPSGDKILLMSNQKIPNYQSNFSFVLSDRAPPDFSLSNINNGGICRITDKTNKTRFDNSVPTLVCDNDECTEINTPLSIDSNGVLTVGGLNNENLLNSFSHLVNYIPSSGNWTLYAQDNDIGGSGVINSWKLVITYVEPEENG